MSKKAGVGLIITGALLFIANMVCSIIFRGDNGANIFTALSGWVSGIATLIVGLIAFRQSYENDKASKKQNIITQITNYMSEFQIAFINYVRVERIVDLNYKIRNCSIERNNRVQKEWELEINDELIYLINMFLKFEAVLLKSNYCSDKIIELHKLLKEMEKKLDDFGADEICKRYEDRVYLDACRKRADYINEWMKKIDKLANTIMLEYHLLRQNILKSDKIQDFISTTELEEQSIIDYFKGISKEQIYE